MIHLTSGNIFEADTQGIVNPVNCVGVMGAGLAKKFKQFYPDMFEAYKEQCTKGELQPGTIFTWVVDLWGEPVSAHYIFNFPTKKHWRDPSTISYIRSGLTTLVKVMKRHDVHSVALPALGCGLGGLEWPEVKDLIISQFQQKAPNKDVFLYEPHE
jgi:O-acetyl-ADP-ribose deacetylase (regulator of RNase III)